MYEVTLWKSFRILMERLAWFSYSEPDIAGTSPGFCDTKNIRAFLLALAGSLLRKLKPDSWCFLKCSSLARLVNRAYPLWLYFLGQGIAGACITIVRPSYLTQMLWQLWDSQAGRVYPIHHWLWIYRNKHALMAKKNEKSFRVLRSWNPNQNMLPFYFRLNWRPLWSHCKTSWSSSGILNPHTI